MRVCRRLVGGRIVFLRRRFDVAARAVGARIDLCVVYVGVNRPEHRTQRTQHDQHYQYGRYHNHMSLGVTWLSAQMTSLHRLWERQLSSAFDDCVHHVSRVTSLSSR